MRASPVPLPQAVASHEPRRWASGVATLDAALAGGLAYGHVHEVYAAQPEDAPSAAALALALATAMTAAERNRNGPVMWLRSTRAVRHGGIVQASGWTELGGTPDRALLAVVPDAIALLRASVDALRCAALGAVIVEHWGTMRELDLTASRRLMLAARQSGVPLFVVRADADPVPSAALTRWEVAAAPSRALPGNAPGFPTFDITLLRQRSGPSGLDWRLEWDRDRTEFREAALSGLVVPVPVRGPAAHRGAGWSARPLRLIA